MAFAALGSLVLVLVVGVTLAVVRSQPPDLGLLPDGEPPGPEMQPGDPIDAAGKAAEPPELSLSEALKTGAFWLLFLGHVLWTFDSLSSSGTLPRF